MPDSRPFYIRWFSRSRFAMVIGISLVIHFIIGIFFGGAVIFDMLTAPEPQLEAPAIPQSIDPIKREYKIKMKRSQQQSAAPLPMPIIAEIPSDLSLDNIDLSLSNPRSDVRIRGAGDGDGTGQGFGDGFGDSSGFELDLQIDFFGIKGGGQNVVFVIDFSSSLLEGDGHKESIMRAEATRVIEELPMEVDFGLIFFGGPAWPGMEDVRESADNWVYTRKVSEAAVPTTFRPKKWSRLPKVRWYGSDTGARKRALTAIRKTPTIFGTVFDVPMYMALTMNPVPDTIFFMTDGQCDPDRGINPIQKMISQMKAMGKPIPVIHTVGLGISGNSQLEQIARLGNGSTRFVSTEAYFRKNGNVKFPPTDDPVFSTSSNLEDAPIDKYPIEFKIK